MSGASVDDEPGRLFSVQEAADSAESPIGGRVSASKLYRLNKAGLIPGAVRIGRKVFLTESGLRRFIAQGGAR